jgi:multidrug efflux pump
VGSLSSSIGVDGQNAALAGRMLVNLKGEGQRGDLDTVLGGLEKAVADIPGVRVYFRPVQDLTIDTSTGVNAYRFSVQGADQDLVDQWGAKLATALKADSHLRNVTTNVLADGRAVVVDINRDTAGRLGLSADDRQRALRRLRPAHRLDHLHPVQPEPRDPGSAARLDHRPAGAGRPAHPLAGGQRSAVHRRHDPHRGYAAGGGARAQFPAAIGFDWPRRLAGLGRAGDRTDRTGHRHAARSTNFSGAASAFKSSLATSCADPRGDRGGLYRAGRALESFVHPVTILSTLPSAGIGALLGLWLTGSGLGVIGIIGIVLLIGIVKKNAIMMIDFALEAMRHEGAKAHEAIRQAARCVSGRS